MTIPFDETRKKWLEDPAFIKEYDALAPEFHLARELLAARSTADLSQQEVAVSIFTSNRPTKLMIEKTTTPNLSGEFYKDAEQ